MIDIEGSKKVLYVFRNVHFGTKKVRNVIKKVRKRYYTKRAKFCFGTKMVLKWYENVQKLYPYKSLLFLIGRKWYENGTKIFQITYKRTYLGAIFRHLTWQFVVVELSQPR